MKFFQEIRSYFSSVRSYYWSKKDCMSLEGMEESLSVATANSPATADVEASGAVLGAILDK